MVNITVKAPLGRSKKDPKMVHSYPKVNEKAKGDKHNIQPLPAGGKNDKYRLTPTQIWADAGRMSPQGRLLRAVLPKKKSSGW